MIIIDYSQLVISKLMAQMSHNYGGESSPENGQTLNEDLVRRLVLNELREIAKKFKKCGDIVIACDGPSYWRKTVFKEYKQHRKKERDESRHDWSAIFSVMKKIREEFVDNMPYKVILVDGAEADDIIATLTKRHCIHEQVVIISSDKDFLQLQTSKNVRQWCPSASKFITTDDPKRDKVIHIIRGDKRDGIPNALSPNDSFVTGVRQKSVTSVKLAEWVKLSYDELSEHKLLGDGFKRNKLLIDLDNIPTSISQAIVEKFESYSPKPRAAMINYFMSAKLQDLISNIDEF